MKWTEFIIRLVLDALLLSYLIASLAECAPPATVLAKVIYGIMCILSIAGTRITYKEAKDGKKDY